jgi:hypothetical protein
MSRCLGDFKFKHYKELLKTALSKGYKVYALDNIPKKPKEPFIILRHDVEYFPHKAMTFADIENGLGIKSSFFFRLHAKEYNVLEYKTLKIIKDISKMGHEVGLHEETLDVRHITKESPEKVLKRDLKVLESITGKKVSGVSSHNDFSGINNLDLWKSKSPKSFGLRYQAYEKRFFKDNRYVSDSLGKWKYYEGGKLVEDNSRCICEHIKEGYPRIYTLIHPRTWYHKAYFLEYL